MKKNVLLIDDSVTIHRVIDLSIDVEKYDVVKVFSKEDAAQKLTEKVYDFILLDNKLDDVVVADYVPFLKSRSVGSRVVLLVGAFDKFNAADLSKSGADDYLVKPFDAQSLNAKLAVGEDEQPDEDSGGIDFSSSGAIEGFMAPNFVDGLAIADAMREEDSSKSYSAKPVNDGKGVPMEMLSGTQYLASLESELSASDNEGYEDEDVQPLTPVEPHDDEQLPLMLGTLDPSATIGDTEDITSEEASGLEFLENENMKNLPATEDDIDNAQYAEDTFSCLEFMDPVLSALGDSQEATPQTNDAGLVEDEEPVTAEPAPEENEDADHISDEKEIARIYSLENVQDGNADNDYGLTAESFDTLPFDDRDEDADPAADPVEIENRDMEMFAPYAEDSDTVKHDENYVDSEGAFDEFEKCLEVMSADMDDDEKETCETQETSGPDDEASGLSEEPYIETTAPIDTVPPVAPIAPVAPVAAVPLSSGGISISISREEIMAIVGQAIDKRLLEETLRDALSESIREVIKNIVPAIAEKYIKEEIERLKDE